MTFVCVTTARGASKAMSEFKILETDDAFEIKNSENAKIGRNKAQKDAFQDSRLSPALSRCHLLRNRWLSL